MSVDLITKFWMAGIIIFGASFYFVALYLSLKPMNNLSSDN